MTTKFVTKIEIEIPAQTIADLITSVLESGVSSWIGKADYGDEVASSKITKSGYPLYSRGEYYKCDGWQVRFHHDGPESVEGNFDIVTVLDAERVNAALSNPLCLACISDITADNYDADTADTFIQLALLGDIVFA